MVVTLGILRLAVVWMTGGAVAFGALDRTGDRPPYRQIADHLRAAIERGELQPGDKLPSEAVLIRHYHVARMTARQAVQELRGEGRVVSEQGRGVFVRQPLPVRRLASERFARRHREAGLAAFSAEAAKSGFTPSVDQIEVSRALPPPEVRTRLRLPEESFVVVRSRRYLADDRQPAYPQPGQNDPCQIERIGVRDGYTRVVAFVAPNGPE